MSSTWKEIKLVDLASFRRGSFPQPYGLDKWYDDNKGMPFIQVFDVGDNMKLKRETKRKISKLGSLMSVFIPKGTLILTIQGSIGRVAITDYDAYMDRTLLVFQKFHEEVDLTFVMYLIRELFSIAKENANGSTIKTITKEELSDYKIYLPPLPQQQEIAKILSTCDEVIEKTEAAISKFQALKQGMMQDLFTRGIDLKTGKLRPSYKEAPELYNESKLGKIPKEWKEGKFIDFADERVSHSFTGGPFGSDLQSKDYTTNGVRIIQLQNIGDGHFNNGYKIFTSHEKANYLRACNIYPGEIILSKMAEPIARACIIPNYHDRYLMSSDGIRLSINKQSFNLRFVLETINQKRFRNIVELKSTGTTRSRIGLTELKDIPICYPQFDEQNLIGQKLENLQNLIEIEQSVLIKYKKLKIGLMQDLLSGKVEVNVENNVENTVS